ncbi:MAG TPA: hypothetical protein VMF31_02115 [Solirubrobacterales bacterium]|nr:hypothetical protein [Solirubrobacterales bacterium]
MGKKTFAILLLITAGFAALAGLTAADAGAVRYTVTQCGWHVGQDAAWADTSADKFLRSSYCQTPESADPFDGVHLSSQTRDSASTVAGTRFARWRWQAPPGTGIVTVDGQRWQVLRDGFQHRIGGVDPGGDFEPFAQLTSTDTVKRGFASSFSPFAKAVESRLLCAKAEDKLCSASSNSSAGVRGLTITLDDSLKPGVSAGGPLTGGEWLRGSQAVTYSAGDTGSGIRFGQTFVDGAQRAQTEHGCAKAFIAGQWRGTEMQPCSGGASGSHAVQTAGLSDGPHQLRQCAVDFAGNTGCAADLTIRTDNTAPAAPRALNVDGGEGWRRENGFRLGWLEPDQGRAAPIASYGYRMAGPGSGTDPAWRFGNGSTESIRVPGPGEFRVSVWLADRAGNTDPRASEEAVLRLDDVAPTAYFVEPPSEDPDRLRVAISDEHSGPAGGTISFRRQGEDEWRRLPAEQGGDLAGRHLEARFPSEDLEPGIYEFQARVLDLAGNGAVTERRGNGSAMTLTVSPKVEPELSARLSRKGESSPRMVVPFGEAATVTGRLSTPGGAGIAGQTIRVEQRPSPGSIVQTSSEVTQTDAHGGFVVAVAPGASRTLFVRFDETRKLAGAAVGPLEFRVKGSIRLNAVPRALRTGRRLRLNGSVDMRWTARQERGSLVAIQYLERTSGLWRPVLVARCDRLGRFQRTYRFRYITGSARIRLRAVLLPSQNFPFESSASKAVTVRVKGRGAGERRDRV